MEKIFLVNWPVLQTMLLKGQLFFPLNHFLLIEDDMLIYVLGYLNS